MQNSQHCMEHCSGKNTYLPQELVFLKQSAAQLLACSEPQAIYEFVASSLRKQSGASVAGVVLCEEEHLLGSIAAVSAEDHIMEATETVLGRSLKHSPIAVPQALRQGSANVSRWSEYVYSHGQADGPTFRLDLIYSFPIRIQGAIVGVAAALLPVGSALTPESLTVCEILAQQAALALQSQLNRETTTTFRLTSDIVSLLNSIREQANTAILLTESGRIIEHSSNARAMLGFHGQSLQNLPVAELFPSTASAFGPLFGRLAAAEKGIAQSLEAYICTPRNSARILELHLVPFKVDKCRTLVQILMQDITERKEMQEALLESEARYRELFETSSDGIALTDENGHYVDANKAFLEILGHSSLQDIVGKSYVDITPEEYRELDIQMIDKLKTAPCVEFEKEYYRQDATRVLVWIRIWKRFDTRGRNIGGWSLIRDITNLRRMEEDLSHIQKFRLLGELAAAMSHEIRNPLTTVRGFLQLLPRRSAAYSESDREIFALMINEVDSATDIIRDFLDLARPSEPETRPFSLTKMLGSLVRVMESRAIMQKVEVRLVPDAGDIEILGDPTQLRQAFINLIQNALQAMPEGGTLDIVISICLDRVSISISDTGVGIPAEHLDKLGRLFFTTKPGGTGLGLATCYRIINAHHGRVAATSAVNRGSCFRVCLPLNKETSISHPECEKCLCSRFPESDATAHTNPPLF